MDRGEEDPREYAFGFVRTVCPGQYLADLLAAHRYAIAMILAVFDLQAIDGQRNWISRILRGI